MDNTQVKVAVELLYQASMLMAAMESNRRQAAISALVRIETLARALRSVVDEQ